MYYDTYQYDYFVDLKIFFVVIVLQKQMEIYFPTNTTTNEKS